MIVRLLGPLSAILAGLHTHSETEHEAIRYGAIAVTVLGVYVALRICAK